MPGSGSGPPDKADITPSGNPFSGPGENERLMWAWGLRNPFRFSIDPLSGDLFLGDVGLISWEEIDRVPYAGPHGENFGWPHLEGFFDPGLGRTCGENNTFTDPTLAYAHGPIAAVTCGPVYRIGSGDHVFPAAYEGRLFYTDIYKGWIRALIDSAGTWVAAPVVPGQANSNDWVANFGYLTDLQVGNDGALYVMRLYPVPGRPSGLYRIRPFKPIGAEPPPAARAWSCPRTRRASPRERDSSSPGRRPVLPSCGSWMRPAGSCGRCPGRPSLTGTEGETTARPWRRGCTSTPSASAAGTPRWRAGGSS
jgi:hypothetical protein